MQHLQWSIRLLSGDVQWSLNPYKRFSIGRTTDGYTVADHKRHAIARFKTLAAARVWAGIRVGEEVDRRGKLAE